MIDISKLSNENLNSLFISKLSNYDIIFNKYLTEDEINNRKQVILNNIQTILFSYFNSKNSLPVIDEKEIKKDLEMLNYYNSKLNEIKTKEDVINTLINDESEFLDFITLNNGLSGITYNDQNKMLFKGINDSIKTGILNVISLTKTKNSSFYYEPKEENASVLYQIKDSVFLDMQELLGDDLVKYFMLGNGDIIYNKLFHLAMSDSFAMANYDITNEELIDSSIKKVEELSDGIDDSVYNNDESYYKRYIETMKEYKTLEKNIDWNIVDDIVKKQNKGLK